MLANHRKDEDAMPKTSQSVINQLQQDRRFKGTCPACSERFVLADATMFPVGNTLPADAASAVKNVRGAIAAKRLELVESYKRMTEGAQRTSHAVNLGKIIEKIVPSFDSFMHHPGDCRALFEPIDYLIFSGLAKRGVVESLIFVDVKSGKARLKASQKQIKTAVQAGAVEFAEIGRAK
jgi:hypothetical protein